MTAQKRGRNNNTGDSPPDVNVSLPTGTNRQQGGHAQPQSATSADATADVATEKLAQAFYKDIYSPGAYYDDKCEHDSSDACLSSWCLQDLFARNNVTAALKSEDRPS